MEHDATMKIDCWSERKKEVTENEKANKLASEGLPSML